MNDKTPVGKLTSRDLVYEALLFVMSKVEVTVAEDSRFLAVYWELKDRLEKGEDVCVNCGSKEAVCEMVEK